MTSAMTMTSMTRPAVAHSVRVFAYRMHAVSRARAMPAVSGTTALARRVQDVCSTHPWSESASTFEHPGVFVATRKKKNAAQ
jgi:hypothetical protein